MWLSGPRHADARGDRTRRCCNAPEGERAGALAAAAVVGDGCIANLVI